MTDKELIELAAKAYVDKCWHDDAAYMQAFLSKWNPLTDDGDALRLAVELSLIDEGDWPQVTNEIYDHCGGDWFASTRRAITMAAAQIGKEME